MFVPGLFQIYKESFFILSCLPLQSYLKHLPTSKLLLLNLRSSNPPLLRLLLQLPLPRSLNLPLSGREIPRFHPLRQHHGNIPPHVSHLQPFQFPFSLQPSQLLQRSQPFFFSRVIPRIDSVHVAVVGGGGKIHTTDEQLFSQQPNAHHQFPLINSAFLFSYSLLFQMILITFFQLDNADCALIIMVFSLYSA